MSPRTVRRRTWVSAHELPHFLEDRRRRAETHRYADLARNQRYLSSRIMDLEDSRVPWDEVKALVLDYYTHVGPASPERVARTLGYSERMVREICDDLVAEGELGPSDRSRS